MKEAARGYRGSEYLMCAVIAGACVIGTLVLVLILKAIFR